MVGLSIVALTGAVGIGMDTAAMDRSATQLQDAADAAALHAVKAGVSRGLDDDAIATAAEVFLLSAFDSSDASDSYGTPSVSVEVSRSPLTVEVEATRPVKLPFGFLREEGAGDVTRVATAVEAQKVAVSLLLLGSGEQAWRATGNSTVKIENGAAVVNSTSSKALGGSGGAKIVADETLVAGPVQSAGQWTPTPKFNATAVPDPFASKINWPSAGPCKAENTFKKKTKTITAGTYCGGLDLNTQSNITLEPGVYVLTGPLSVTSHSRLNAPSGVTIVLIGATSNVNVQSGSELILRAPTSGDWKNIAIAQKPQTQEVTSTLIGGGEMQLEGVIYMPTQKLTLTGGGAAGLNTGKRIVVTNRLETQGNGEIRLKGDEDVLSINQGARLAS